MDTVSQQTRSRMMAGIRSAGTKPERIVRTTLFAEGFRYRKNCRDLPGKPDIKLTKYRAVILVHGCFWHGHGCRYYRIPASNAEFWTVKIQHNRERDARDIVALTGSGWRVCVVWECATRIFTKKDAWASVTSRLATWIRGTEPALELYDVEAIAAAPAGFRSGARETGFNTDKDVFVAERRDPYPAE